MYPQETTLYKAILIVSVTIGVIIILFVLSVLKTQMRYKKLNSKKLQDIVDSIEKERRRIAFDLHDELGPVLSSIKLRLSAIDSISESDKKIVCMCLTQIDVIINKVRAIAFNFTPSVLAQKGLGFAVQHYIDNYIFETGLKVCLIADKELILAKPSEIHLYRILQEIIYNTVKHAKATELKIEMHIMRKHFFILSSDNGTGFDYKEALRNPLGNGLQSLHTRAEILGGEINVSSKYGYGTSYHIKFPLIKLSKEND